VNTVLLHICCGVCAFYPIERLKEEGFCVVGFFFNPNIHPESEYLKRKQVSEKVAKLTSIEITKGEYEPKIWLDACRDYEDEPEGHKRCFLCYELRLKKTLEVCKEKKFNCFATTLTVSPHKNSKAIIETGESIGGDYFLPVDFKKRDGFKKTIELSKKFNLYRQSYCGCVYSREHLPAGKAGSTPACRQGMENRKQKNRK